MHKIKDAGNGAHVHCRCRELSDIETNNIFIGKLLSNSNTDKNMGWDVLVTRGFYYVNGGLANVC
jgi:hypothetical protein